MSLSDVSLFVNEDVKRGLSPSMELGVGAVEEDVLGVVDPVVAK